MMRRSWSRITRLGDRSAMQIPTSCCCCHSYPRGLPTKPNLPNQAAIQILIFGGTAETSRTDRRGNANLFDAKFTGPAPLSPQGRRPRNILFSYGSQVKTGKQLFGCIFTTNPDPSTFAMLTMVLKRIVGLPRESAMRNCCVQLTGAAYGFVG